MLSAVELPPTPLIKEFHIFAPLLGSFNWPSFCSRLSQQPKDSDSRMNLGRGFPTTQPQSAGVKITGG